MAHYLDEEIKRLEASVAVEKEIDGARLYRGEFGAARVVKNRVHFFEIGAVKADETFEMATQRGAKLAGLEWVAKGRV